MTPGEDGVAGQLDEGGAGERRGHSTTARWRPHRLARNDAVDA